MPAPMLSVSGRLRANSDTADYPDFNERARPGNKIFRPHDYPIELATSEKVVVDRAAEELGSRQGTESLGPGTKRRSAVLVDERR